MTPDTQPPREGRRRPAGHRRNAGTAIRSGGLVADVARTGRNGTGAHAAHASPRPRAGAVRPGAAGAERARGDASIVGVIPLLAVLVVVVAGVYVAWRQGSAGGGEGGVLAGAALLVGAVARLLLPVRLAGLLATRKRATDVLTLAVFGVGLLVAGLVLPR
jgi:Protein of unknown function (DUF3017)